MATNIKCPNCSFEFALEDALSAEQKEALDKEKQQLRQQMLDYKKQKEEELRSKEEDYLKKISKQEESFKARLDAELKQQQQQQEQLLRKNISADYENQLRLLQQSIADNEEKLKQSRKKELEYLQKEQQLKIKEEELEISLQKKLIEERDKLKTQVLKEEAERLQLKETEHQLQMKELQKQLDDQKKLVDELKRKQEQGSMQLQGEVQELLLEEILRITFPYDAIEEVGKGIRGADCIQTVRNRTGIDAGKIIYESKRTKDFQHDWIDKLKSDMRKLGADTAVIVSQALPKDIDRFGEKDGVYICTFAEVRNLAALLRDAILKLYDARKSQENKGDKMVMLYDYLTGSEFGEQWKAIREGFMTMKLSIQKERDAMEKLWKAREKQLEKVLLNAAHVKGSIEGIAGADAVNLNLIEGDEDLLAE